MEERLIHVLQKALHRLSDHADLVKISNVDESTFRSFLLAEIMLHDPGAQCQTEWHLFDLLIQTAERSVAVELKFYIMRQTRELDGRLGQWKGEAGSQNEREFWACVDKLHQLGCPGIGHKYLVLIYQRANPRKSKYSFALSYDDLKPNDRIKMVTTICHEMGDRLACKLIEIA